MNRPATFTIVTEDAGEGIPHMYTSRYKSCLKPEPSSSRGRRRCLWLYLLSEIWNVYLIRRRHHVKLKIRKAVSVPTLSTGGLSLAVEGPSKAEISCKDNKDGTCTVSYLPTAPGDYNIIVKFDDKHISGSPFTAKITGKKFSLLGKVGLLSRQLSFKQHFLNDCSSKSSCSTYDVVHFYDFNKRCNLNLMCNFSELPPKM